MLEALKGLFTSKKFYLTIIGTIVVTVMQASHLPIEIILTVAALFGVNAAGIAMQDKGKEVAKIEAQNK